MKYLFVCCKVYCCLIRYVFAILITLFYLAQEPPVDVKISKEMTNQFLVSWNDNNARSNPYPTLNYIVIYTTNETNQSRQTSWTQTQLTINGLTSNTKYVVYVKKQATFPDVFSDDSIPENGTTGKSFLWLFCVNRFLKGIYYNGCIYFIGY